MDGAAEPAAGPVRAGDEVMMSRTRTPERRRDLGLARHGLAPRIPRIVVNLAGAAGAALFAQASLQFYLSTHSLIGGAFLIEQTWFVIAFLVRRPPSAISRDPGSWLLAFGGTFAGVLF